MKRTRCKFCHAKPRVQFAVIYGGREMCQECRYEYQAIFEGKVSKTFDETKDPLKEPKRWSLEDIESEYGKSLRMWDGYYNEAMIENMQKGEKFKFNKIKRDEDV